MLRANCLLNRTPADVVEQIKKSGLRGRGGGGFPTGLKWEIAAKNKADEKYVVCNADEGDPGAFMDRSIMEGDPNSIVEAMEICGYATGANHGLVYIRAEYPHFILGSGFQTLTFTELKVETDCIGYAGIVVIIGMDGNYHAHDMGCPRCLNRKEPVKIVGMYAECPNCHEQYDLSYGYALPTKGISREPLRKYTATYSSLSGKLTITP